MSKILLERTIGNFMLVPPMMGVDSHNLTQADAIATPQEAFSVFFAPLRQIWPILLVYEIVTVTIATGLTNAMSAFAYRNITAPASEASA